MFPVTIPVILATEEELFCTPYAGALFDVPPVTFPVTFTVPPPLFEMQYEPWFPAVKFPVTFTVPVEVF
jgi:hypothetical protein